LALVAETGQATWKQQQLQLAKTHCEDRGGNQGYIQIFSFKPKAATQFHCAAF